LFLYFFASAQKSNKKSRRLGCKPKNKLHCAKIIKLLPCGQSNSDDFLTLHSVSFLHGFQPRREDGLPKTNFSFIFRYYNSEGVKLG